MFDFELISALDRKAWRDRLSLCGEFDTYHLPEYHMLAKENGEGEPYLFFFKYGGGFGAFPFLLRRVAEVEGLEDYRQVTDITTVYGYPGIVTSIGREDDIADIFRRKFQTRLNQQLRKLGVVSLFCRTHPLFDTLWLLKEMGEVVPLAVTVGIDLTRPEEDQVRGMTKGHRYDIRKARRRSVIVRQDESFRQLETFISFYNETMERNAAAKFYYFKKEYFFRLKKLLGDSLRLFLAEEDGAVISASLFLATGRILQYHLSGTPQSYLQHGGSKVIIDEVRKWGKERGFSWLYLGGGVGGQADSLFRFKCGFSKLRYQYDIVKIILEPELYSELMYKRGLWESKNGLVPASNSYFPQYRRGCVREKQG